MKDSKNNNSENNIDNNNDSCDFKLDFNNDKKIPSIKSEIKNQRLEKLSQKVNLFSILLPCIIFAIIAIAYIDINGKISKFNTTGLENFQNLSKDFSKSINSLKLKYAILDDSISKETKKLIKIEKITALIKRDLKNTLKTISKIQTAKTDKKLLTNNLNQIQSKLNKLQNNQKENAAKVKYINTKTDKKLTSFYKRMIGLKKNINKFNGEIFKLQTKKADKTKIDEIVKQSNGKYKEEMKKHILRKFEQKLNFIQKQLSDLENNFIIQTKAKYKKKASDIILEQDLQ